MNDALTTQPALVTVKEMAALLKVSPFWLYQRTRLGATAIPHLKVGRNVRFDPAEVLAFLKEQQGRGQHSA